MNRRDLLALLGTAGLSRLAPGPTPLMAQEPPRPADFTLRIGPVSIELAPKKIIKTIGYNGSAPGPLLRVPEGREIAIDVHNDSSDPELVHWHGLHIASEVDGSMEEGTPMLLPRTQARYIFTPAPSGTRWYHTHSMAMRNLKRAAYTGQFGFFYVDPRGEPGNYDQEVFLALREWDPYFTTMGDGGEEVAYRAFSVNDRALGHGEPIRVKEGQRVMLRILNASATVQRRIACAGHSFEVTALDGNPVAVRKKVDALELGPAERIDAVVEMNRPGVWILGATGDHDRQGGLGIVVEYSGQSGSPRWVKPSDERWSYTVFGSPPSANPQVASADLQGERVVLAFEKKFAGSRWIDKWMINGKSYPETDPIRVRPNQKYRLVFENRSDEAHPVHLHRHTFELASVAGVATSGIFKDVVVVQPMSKTEVDFVADNPGLTLFHCHQQMHMDYGFMALMRYVS
jgi:FtsP/CotA-like multicopper oxidase with cupredoxin domain